MIHPNPTWGSNALLFNLFYPQILRKRLILTQQAKEFEIRKGEILLMSLLGRYFVIQINCWEPNGKMRTDKINTEQYINELKQLSQDVNDLVTNPFYIEVLEKYPEINLLWISLRRFIIQKEQDRKMSVDPQLFDKFHDLYFKIKNEIPKLKATNKP